MLGPLSMCQVLLDGPYRLSPRATTPASWASAQQGHPLSECPSAFCPPAPRPIPLCYSLPAPGVFFHPHVRNVHFLF